jgi:hypothetical protein
LIIIASAASALSDRAFGIEALWFWKLLFGALATALALLGPIGFVRRFVRKFAIWAVAASIAYLAWWIPAHSDLHGLWSTSGNHDGSFFAGMDLIIALSVSWIPLVADYTRFSTGRRAAFWGAGLGYLFPTLFQFGFGAILVLSHPSISDPVDVLTTIAAGGVASFLALLALTVDETDEAFANVYSTAMSLQNFAPAFSQRALIVGCAVISTAGALSFNLTQYPQFLYLLGAFFVPLFGVLLADWIQRGMSYTREDVFAGPAVRPAMIGAWLCGFALYEWLAQSQGLGFWTNVLGSCIRSIRRSVRRCRASPSRSCSHQLSASWRVAASSPPRRTENGRPCSQSSAISRSTGSRWAAAHRRRSVLRGRAFRLVAARGEVVALWDADRRFLGPRLAALGLPTTLLHADRTTTFSFDYDGDKRVMNVDAIGDPWTPHDARAVDSRVRWPGRAAAPPDAARCSLHLGRMPVARNRPHTLPSSRRPVRSS